MGLCSLDSEGNFLGTGASKIMSIPHINLELNRVIMFWHKEKLFALNFNTEQILVTIVTLS